jgi:hypothetical protein
MCTRVVKILTRPVLLPMISSFRKKQNVSFALMVPLLKEMGYIFSDRSAQRTLTKQHQLR